MHLQFTDLNKKVEKYLELYKKSYKLAVKALGFSEIIDKLDFEETKEENDKFVDTVNKFQDIRKEEFFLKQEIDFSSLSKTRINEINKICKKLEDPIIALIEFIDSYFELKNKEKENKKN